MGISYQGFTVAFELLGLFENSHNVQKPSKEHCYRIRSGLAGNVGKREDVRWRYHMYMYENVMMKLQSSIASITCMEKLQRIYKLKGRDGKDLPC